MSPENVDASTVISNLLPYNSITFLAKLFSVNAERLFEAAASGLLECQVEIDENELEYTGPRNTDHNHTPHIPGINYLNPPLLSICGSRPIALPPKKVWVRVLPEKIREAIDNDRLLKGHFLINHRCKIKVRINVLFVSKVEAEKFWLKEVNLIQPLFQQENDFSRITLRGHQAWTLNETQSKIIKFLYEISENQPNP